MKVLFGLLLLVSLGYSRVLPKELDLSLGLGAGLHYSWVGPHLEVRYLVTKRVGVSIAYLPTTNSFNSMAWLDFKRWKYGMGPVFGHQLIVDECELNCGPYSANKNSFYGFDLVTQYDFGAYEGFVVRGGVGVLVFQDRYSYRNEGILLFVPSLGFHYQL